ncbi:MAG: hypothetical protein R2710_02050 [Acidimicrobiales bacterium]
MPTISSRPRPLPDPTTPCRRPPAADGVVGHFDGAPPTAISQAWPVAKADDLASIPSTSGVALVGITLLFAREDGGGFLVPIFTYLAAWLFWPTDDSPALIRQLGHRAGQQEIAGALAVFALATLVIGRQACSGPVSSGAAIALLGNRPGTRHGSASHRGRPPTADTGKTGRSWGRSLRGAVGPRELNRPVRAPRRPHERPHSAPHVSLLVAYGFACVLIDRLVEPGLDPALR